MKIKNGYLVHEVAGNYVVIKIGQEAVNFNGLITISESAKELWDLLLNKERPYFESEGSKIYVPIYSKGLNYIYYDTPHKLLGYPYD